MNTPESKNVTFKVKTIEIAGISSALSALRLPFGGVEISECEFIETHEDLCGTENATFATCTTCNIDEKDMKLLSTLVKNGDEHAKVVRGIMVWAEIDAPIWFYRELETYRVGRERLACNSTMHQQCKGLSGVDLENAKDEMPMGTYQRSVDMISYQTLRRVWQQRHNHRLPMWREFCNWIETLPFAKDLILVGLK